MIGLIFAALALYGAFLLWRVRVERGRVHRSIYGLFAVRLARMQLELGQALLPALRRLALQLEGWFR